MSLAIVFGIFRCENAVFKESGERVLNGTRFPTERVRNAVERILERVPDAFRTQMERKWNANAVLGYF